MSVNPMDETVKPLRISIEPLEGEEKLPVGEATELLFKLIDQDSGEAQVGLDDLWVWVFSSRGWSTRRVAEPLEDGVYRIELTLPRSGSYNMIIASATLGVRFEDNFPAMLRAVQSQEP